MYVLNRNGAKEHIFLEIPHETHWTALLREDTPEEGHGSQERAGLESASSVSKLRRCWLTPIPKV